MYKFEVYKDKGGEFRFRFKASNGETMFTGVMTRVARDTISRYFAASRSSFQVPRSSTWYDAYLDKRENWQPITIPALVS